MSDETAHPAGEEELSDEELRAGESPALAALLKRSFDAQEPRAPLDDKKLLTGVQSRLRQRSRGKFYADGWSTTHSRINYVLVALVMLVTIVVVYFALGPTGISR